MEQLIHYVWKHKLFPLTGLKTTDGQEVEVIDTGLHNHNAGPDFFNAKVKIGGTLWVGNVEIHDRASDWFRHRCDCKCRRLCENITKSYSQQTNILLVIVSFQTCRD